MEVLMSLLDCIGRTPLLPLRRIGAELPVPVLVKCEHLNPAAA
jgi:cysteine synthase